MSEASNCLHLKGVALVATLSMLALAALLLGLDKIPVAHAGTLDVCPTCTYTTIQSAINAASDGDIVRVAAGTYTEHLSVTKSITLSGGWNATFTSHSPGTSIVDGSGTGRVVQITGPCTPTVDGFTITGGNATSEAVDAGWGGGIYSSYASPIIQNNVIISNIAAISPTWGNGGGVALAFASASTLISSNQVLSNTTCSGGGERGYGGGIYLWSSNATIAGNLVRGNSGCYYGGGLAFQYGAPRLLDNEIRGNVAGRNGGGIYLLDSSAFIQRNLLVGNVAGWDGLHWNGGGILAVYGSPIITVNRILSNTAGSGGGLGLETNGYFTVTNNVIAHNSDGGIRLWELTRYGLIAHNTIVSNGGEGGISLAYGYITPTIVNNIVVSNTYGLSAHQNASGTLDYNDVWGNTQNYNLPGALEPGPHDIQADPLFANPAADDYHLRPGSPCINVGTNAGVGTDFDGDLRPVGAGYDIGADEFRWYIYLPLMLKSYAP